MTREERLRNASTILAGLMASGGYVRDYELIIKDAGPEWKDAGFERRYPRLAILHTASLLKELEATIPQK